jgi:hypothetical protein
MILTVVTNDEEVTASILFFANVVTLERDTAILGGIFFLVLASTQSNA